MKLKITKDTYKVLIRDSGNPVLCNKRTPVQIPVQSQGGFGMDVAIMETPSSLCGDHCPFFFPQTDINNEIMSVTLDCGHRTISWAIDGIINESAPKII